MGDNFQTQTSECNLFSSPWISKYHHHVGWLLVHSVVMKHDSCKKKLSLREVLYESQPTAVFPGRNLLLDIPVGE